jgi:hypothetical protein
MDINDLAASVTVIDNLLNNDELYHDFLLQATCYQETALNRHQLFPMLVGFLDRLHPYLPKSQQVIRKSGNNNGLISRIIRKIT